MVLLASTAPGISRAELTRDGAWNVARILPEVPVTSLYVDPSDRRNVWAGVQAGGVLRSTDRGRTWRSAGLAGVTVKSVAVSPHDSGVVYAGVKPAGVLATRDGGATWSELTGFREQRRWWWWSPADPPGVQPYVSAVSVSPSDPDVIIAGVELGAVMRSSDGGKSWSSHRRRADRDCHALCFHATNGDWVYEAGGGGPAVSRDGGSSWRHPLKGLDGRYAMSCTADAERPEVWYVAAAPTAVWPKFWQMPIAHYDGNSHTSIYRSSGGAEWEKLAGGLPQPLDHMAYGLLSDPDSPGHVYAGLANGLVWRSTDYGDTWSRLPVDLGAVRRSLVLA